MFNRILLVCTGNICRSPMAEGLLLHRLRDTGREVHSAGTAALVGEPADIFAVLASAERGIRIAPHVAQQVDRQLLSQSDLVLTMDDSHNDWINKNYPQMRGRVHKLGRWRGGVNVPDPFQRPRAMFEEAFDLIELCVGDWLPHILR